MGEVTVKPAGRRPIFKRDLPSYREEVASSPVFTKSYKEKVAGTPSTSSGSSSGGTSSSTIVRSGGGGGTSSSPPPTPSTTTQTRYVYVNPQGATHVYTEKPSDWDRMVGTKQVVSADVPSGTSEAQVTEGMRRFVKEGATEYSYTVEQRTVTREPPASFKPDIVSSQEGSPASFENPNVLSRTLIEKQSLQPVRQGTVSGEGQIFKYGGDSISTTYNSSPPLKLEPQGASELQAEADRRATEETIAHQSSFSAGVEDFIGASFKIQTAPERMVLKTSQYLPSPFKDIAQTSAQQSITKKEFGAGATVGVITAIPSIPATITAVTTRPVETGQAFVEQAATRPSYTVGQIAGSTIVLGKATSVFKPKATPVYEVKYLSHVERQYPLTEAPVKPEVVKTVRVEGKPFGQYTSESFQTVKSQGGVMDKTLFDVKEVKYDFIESAKSPWLHPKAIVTDKPITGKYTTTKPPEPTKGFQILETERSMIFAGDDTILGISRKFVPVEEAPSFYKQFPRSTKPQGKPFEFKPPPAEASSTPVKTTPVKSTGGGGAEVKLTPKQIESKPVLEVNELPIKGGRVSSIDAFKGLLLGQPQKTFTGQGQTFDQFTGQGQRVDLNIDTMFKQQRDQTFKPYTTEKLKVDQTPRFETMSFVKLGFDTTTKQSTRTEFTPTMSFDLGLDFGPQPKSPISPPRTRPPTRVALDLPQPVESYKQRRGKKRGRGYYERTYFIDPSLVKAFR